MSSEPLRVALAGLGTVGAGVVKLLDANRDLIARRAGRTIEVAAVSARDRARDRGVDLARFAWTDDVADLAGRDDVDVVVELIGGSDGPALTLARRAIAAGKGFVTANKAMIAHHGAELAEAAEAAGVALKFEAAVAGGVPVIKGLREGAAANAIAQVDGILNGTCNYILSEMEAKGSDFADVLAEAQRLGFAEADPSFDIDGVDAAHKLAILATVAFGTRPDFDGVEVRGIRDVVAGDIAEAAALGYRVRLIGVAAADAHGLYQRVTPCLVREGHPLARVTGATNAVVAEGDFVGRLLFEGRGAGEGPTASAVVADLIDIARGIGGTAFGMPVASLSAAARADPGARRERAYLRFIVQDRAGVLAELTAGMRDGGVSIESMIQRGAGDSEGVLVAMTTHEGPARAVAAALERLEGSASLIGRPMVMPIVD
ncbi:Homoserine dehydrogenase [Sphingomonas antarctica]|uniref:homoserine dehydrogenase n=1 Tax=Sphingomonas antarctica TaxID=2040274 RepID=UPI0039EC8053